MLELTLKSYEVRFADEWVSAFHECDNLRSADALISERKAISVTSFCFALTEEGVDDTFDKSWLTELLDA